MSEQRNPGQAPGSGRWLRVRRVLMWIGVGLVGAVLLITAAYYLDVATESKEFCGLLCHPNRPEYVTHEASPHANVECGTCHVGPGLTPKITAKIYGVGELVSLLTNSYDRPIQLPVERLRPARDICEQCHWPGISNPDRLRLIETFAADEQNTGSRTSLTMRLGGGQTDGSAGQGVHWHVANPVQYVATDRLNQQIAWVGLTVNGQQVGYQQQGVQLTPEQLAKLPRRDMDCLDCHNRATHVFVKPEQKLDEALASGRIDRSLPFVKREGLKLLSASYPSQDKGVAAMVGLADFYRSQYPSVLSAKQQAIDQAVAALQDIYRQTVFPEMNLTWQAYPNNLGHADFPGCFRCHDGQHLNAQGEAIPANCTLCHSVPVATQVGQQSDLGLAVGAPAAGVTKPDSHLKATFLADHRVLADESCVRCHGPIQYGVDNSSFCANGLCHGQEWPNLNLRAGFTHPIQLVGQHATTSCNACHQGVRKPSIKDCASCHKPPSTLHFGTECSKCHTPEGWAQSASRWVTGAPAIPHPVEAATDCLTCHGAAGRKPVPASHEGIPSASCTYCHKGQAAAPLTGPPIPHRVQGPDTCQTCHGQGPLEPTSAIHVGIPAGSCLTCHTSVPLVDVPTIPHVIEGRDTCLTCHDQGKLKPEPVNHQGWPNEACLLCHKVLPAATPVAGPAIPHRIDGLATCLSCHGQAPLKPVSVVHQGISTNAPSDTCLACHKSVPLTDVLAVPHRTQGREDCLACHGQGEEGRTPENHKGWPKESCLLCHRGS